MSEDFFSKIDAKVAVLAAEKQTREELVLAARDKTLAIISEGYVIAKQYVTKLRDRNIAVSINGSEKGFAFELAWADNSVCGVSFYPDMDTGQIKVVRNTVDATTGHPSSRTPVLGRDPFNIEAALQREIDEYVSTAEKHGGLGTNS